MARVRSVDIMNRGLALCSGHIVVSWGRGWDEVGRPGQVDQ
jgi:hypothetical protein